MTCIICPIGCQLTVETGETFTVTGNRCPRGAVYAEEEIRSPKRVVTATCAAALTGEGGASRLSGRIPVKTALPCPKEHIPALLQDIYALKVALPVKSGDAVIAGWRGTGIDVVAVRTLG